MKAYKFQNEKEAADFCSNSKAQKMAQIKGRTTEWCKYYVQDKVAYINHKPELEQFLSKDMLVEIETPFEKNIKASKALR
jgi:hypothetical protein